MSVLSPRVRHEERECTEHGNTMHSLYYVGIAPTPRWCCLKCEAERQRLYKARKAAGEVFRSYTATAPQPRPKFCPQCFMGLTTAGVCPNECER